MHKKMEEVNEEMENDTMEDMAPVPTLWELSPV